MTAPDEPCVCGTSVAERLSEALGQLAMRGGCGLGVLASERLAADLLPTVRAIVADELRAAADWIWDDVPARASASAELHARADVLDPA